MDNRELYFPGVYNVRDLGGMKNCQGKTLKKRVFIRSGSIHGVTPKGQEQIQALNIKTIIDLRSKQERTHHPNKIFLDNIYSLPMLDNLQSNISLNMAPPYNNIEEMYFHLLEDYKENFQTALRLIASHVYDGGVLFHCTAGKDRTGILSMLLLSISNVSYDSIIKDYALTKPQVVPNLPEKFHYLLAAPPQAMENTLEWLDKKYNGPIGYLENIGVPETTMETIQDAFIY